MLHIKPAILFVCMGNICRSPTAEGVFRALAAQANIIDLLEIDSAGTHGYHINEPPDMRAIKAARQRGYDISGLRARRVTVYDCAHFDYLLAMDHDNLEFLQRLCPPEHSHKLQLFLEYAENTDVMDIPDPYYGGETGFAHVIDLIEAAAAGLIKKLSHQLVPQR